MMVRRESIVQQSSGDGFHRQNQEPVAFKVGFTHTGLNPSPSQVRLMRVSPHNFFYVMRCMQCECNSQRMHKFNAEQNLTFMPCNAGAPNTPFKSIIVSSTSTRHKSLWCKLNSLSSLTLKQLGSLSFISL